VLTKKTTKNQLTIPKALLDQLPESDYFDATVVHDALVLRPVRMVPAVDIERVRDRVAKAGLKPGEAARAVKWARRKKQ
jgi:hypothetical protein